VDLPLECTVKINVDAAYNADQGKGGMCAIARDYKGKFMLASCKQQNFVADPFMAEAYALRDRLSLAQHIGGNKFIVQSDSLQVIETMKNGGFLATSSVALFDNCRILTSGFIDITFELCNREANGVSYELARYSFSEESVIFWDHDPLVLFCLNS
jgi:hypothetical protein